MTSILNSTPGEGGGKKEGKTKGGGITERKKMRMDGEVIGRGEREGEKRQRLVLNSRMSPETSNYTQQENRGELTNTHIQVITLSSTQTQKKNKRSKKHSELTKNN